MLFGNFSVAVLLCTAAGCRKAGCRGCAGGTVSVPPQPEVIHQGKGNRIAGDAGGDRRENGQAGKACVKGRYLRNHAHSPLQTKKNSADITLSRSSSFSDRTTGTLLRQRCRCQAIRTSVFHPRCHLMFTDRRSMRSLREPSFPEPVTPVQLSRRRILGRIPCF